jgi:glycosyltransferase involved in cell wall biosynthesis
MKIAVYAISKNEEQFAERCIKSAAEADCFILCDTGSTDATKQIARDCGAQVFDISISPWRFDHARNASLALIPADVDICICLDLDEVLNAGWRAEMFQLGYLDLVLTTLFESQLCLWHLQVINLKLLLMQGYHLIEAF